MNKYKICHITTVHSPFDVRIFHKECKTLAKSGFKVYLIAQHNKEENKDGVNIIPIPKTNNRINRIISLPLKAFYKALKLKADIYHFHDPELIPICIALRVLGKIVIYDVHEHYSELLFDKLKNYPKNFFTKFIAKLFLEYIPRFFFNYLIFPTESLKEEYKANFKSICLVNFPSIEHVNLSEQNEKSKNYDVVFLGTISPFRMKFIIEVIYQTTFKKNNIRWLFLGIPASTINWIYKNYEKKFIENHIDMIGKVSFEIVLDYLKKSYIGFNYHPYENRFLVAIPMKVFEYMMVGLPVVTTALPELKRYLENGYNAILVDSQKPIDYSDAILNLIESPDKARKIGDAGRNTILKKLNWECSEQNKLIYTYKQLLEKKYG